MKTEPNYSKDYPTAWREGFKRGRDGYNKGFELKHISQKSRFTDFWQRMAFVNGIADGFECEQEEFYSWVL